MFDMNVLLSLYNPLLKFSVIQPELNGKTTTCQSQCKEHPPLPESCVSAMFCCCCQAVNLDAPSEKGKRLFSRDYYVQSELQDSVSAACF